MRRDDELKRFYRRKLAQKGMGKAKVAAGRKLGVRLWIMLRDHIDYAEFCRRGRQLRGPRRRCLPITWSCPSSDRCAEEAIRLSVRRRVRTDHRGPQVAEEMFGGCTETTMGQTCLKNPCAHRLR